MYENLTDRELLSTLILEKSGERVTEKLMEEFSSLPYVFVDSTMEELQRVKGLGVSRARQIKACFELARRLYSKENSPGKVVKCPQDVVDIVMQEMRFLRREVFRIVLLNTKNIIQEIRTVSEGSLSASIVHPREVFSWPVKRSASGIICLHNHPSGDTEPSSEDIDTTRRLIEAGNLLGIKVLDHIIIGNGRYQSMKERGLL